MIKPGRWYCFKSTADKRIFILLAEQLFADSIDHIGEAQKQMLLTKALLRVSPHGHHINYRTDYNPQYEVATLFDSKDYKAQLNSVYGKKETTNMNECYASCGCGRNEFTDALVQKYFDREVAKIRGEADTAIEAIRDGSDVGKTLEAFHKLMKERKSAISIRVTDDMLTEEERAKIEKIKVDADAKIEKARDKAFECCQLLNRTQGVMEYKGILDIYGYIQEGPTSEGKK